MKRFVLPLLLLSLAGPVAAGEPLPPDPLEDRSMVRAGFLSNHPDWEYRLIGYEAYRQGRHDDAFAAFRRAGFFADKLSQAMIAEMYWSGTGVPRDRALAYAWMDLAAERGYASFLRLRERYWRRLDAAERQRALDEGQAIYAQFRDAVAKPRQERLLRMALRSVVGSRTGFGGNGQTLVIAQSGGIDSTVDNTKFYDRQYWEPKQYWQYQDLVQRDIRTGYGSAGELEQHAASDATNALIATDDDSVDEPAPPVEERPR